MSFEQFMEQLLEYAREQAHTNIDLIEHAHFMYEDYHEQGMTPQEAYHAEWG
ncbi:hypothetical protein Roomu2_00061 [Pseudomonas phage vB_PpuM-Roomu-2]|uniref:Uncharacterized protein n=1 Tax=Pseudomonas phage vB_PpuM-Roomu-2 TaxID=3132621 RepID=A0AAX4MYV8_9CAUD